MADRSPLRHRLFAYCLCGAMALGALARPGPARAQAAPASDDELAVGLYQRAAELYRQRRFAEAAVLLREAYRKRPDAVLQYNLGRACEEMGDLPCAVEAYEKYLASSRPADRPAIEQRLAACRARLAEQARAPRPSAAPAPATAELASPAPRPGGAGLAPRIAAGAGVTSVGVGLGLAWWARSRQRQAAREPVQRLAAERQRAAESTMRAANATLIAGGIVAGAAAFWWALDARGARRDRELALGAPEAEVAPPLPVDGPSLGLTLRF